jgi:hypothetical protein
MEKDLIAAIIAAINVYVQEEEIEIEYNKYTNDAPRSDNPDISPWRMFGRQRGVITRTTWRVNKAGR